MVEHEMARTVDDVLSRRSRSLIFDARAARDAARDVAVLLGEHLDRDPDWVENQVVEFATLAAAYIPGP